MDVQSAIRQRRTVRRFQQKPVSREQLKNLVELSRLYASGGNLQPIRYIGVTDSGLREQIFGTLRWAAYLPGFVIEPEQRPMAYVILTCDAGKKKNCQFDLGAAATTLMLAAEGEGLSTCCLGAFDRQKLIDALSLPENTEPLLVIALGVADQKSRMVPYAGTVKYYEDGEGCLCVPKYPLDEILELR